MFNSVRRLPRTSRLLSVLAVTAVTLGGLTACGGDDRPAAADSSSSSSDADQARAAVDAGLKAHAADRLPQAAKRYEEALALDPTNQYALYNMALIEEANGNYGLAEDHYRSALDTDDEYGPALFNLAILRAAADDPDEAISLYERAVGVDKKDAAAWLNLGLLLREEGKERAGDKNVLRALALDPALEDPAGR